MLKKAFLALLWMLHPLCALDYFQSLDQVKRWSDDFVRQQGYKTLESDNYNLYSKATGKSFSIRKQNYMLLYVINTTKENTRPPVVCTGILFKEKLYKGFCLGGFDNLDMQNTRDALLLKLTQTGTHTPTSNTSAQTLLVFKNIEGTFYLVRYAKQTLDNTLFPAGAPKTFYEQESSAYAMGDVNDKLLEKLQNKSSGPSVRSSKEVCFGENVNSTPCAPKYKTKKQDLLSFNVGTDRYSFSKRTTYLDSPDDPSSVCVLTRHNGKLLSRTLCIHQGQVDLAYKFPYLTFEMGQYDSSQDNIYTKLYVTFRLVDSTFYLHQFSQQFFRVGDDGDKKAVRTLIFYRQSRDDPKKRHLMSLDSLEPGFTQKLQARCFDNGYCVY
ncbi:hypothetical protein ACFOPX_04490 [Helicobacter baculiformis]|uniref:Periplasmic protein n=1 Tax=Helicobacter baculiformis TaxID=427351 RepID=A0ABV7ZKL1_9HELI|nr:hypothetical protein [Helicobacter baculiformis]